MFLRDLRDLRDAMEVRRFVLRDAAEVRRFVSLLVTNVPLLETIVSSVS